MKTIFGAFPYQIRRLLTRVRHPRTFKRLQEMRRIDTKTGYSFKSFDQYRCIFIHIPKCAGLSISRSLFGNLAGGHATLKEYQLVFSKREFDKYFKFTFVRNPWSRLVSAFFYLKKGGVNDQDRLWAERNLSSYVDFDSFVRDWVNQKNIEKCFHFLPQYRFICEPRNDIPTVDFIGYFENLEADYCYIQKKLGITSSLRNLNRTFDKDQDYKTFYTETTRGIVADVYRKDIQIFGYHFDGLSDTLAITQNY